MRGIGRGQTILLYVIPEVAQRVQAELGERATGEARVDIPAWLLVQAMRVESLQFVKLAQQEVFYYDYVFMRFFLKKLIF